jgi:two-component system, cell cycle response regulator
METGESIIVEDVDKDKRFSTRVDKFSGFKTQSIIGTPLKTEDKTFGVIELINRISDTPFTSQDLKILSSIAEYAGIAIERSYYNQALTNLATKDSLTGFKNRWSFERSVSNKEAVLRRYGIIFSMLIVGIDKFQHINESGDSSAGSKVIKELAQALTRSKRREDDIFRYGEDTFVLLLPNTYSDGAQKAKKRIFKDFSQTTPEKTDIPASIKISPYTISAEDSGQLKKLVAKFLSRSKTPVNEDLIENIEDSLQPFLEENDKSKAAKIKKAQTIGKDVSLGGEFTRLKTGESGHIRVEKLSLEFIEFRISKSHRIQVNDFLDIHFILDNIKKSLVKRRIIIRSIKGNYIHADFYNPPPYAKKLGFYLMN